MIRRIAIWTKIKRLFLWIFLNSRVINFIWWRKHWKNLQMLIDVEMTQKKNLRKKSMNWWNESKFIIKHRFCSWWCDLHQMQIFKSRTHARLFTQIMHDKFSIIEIINQKFRKRCDDDIYSHFEKCDQSLFQNQKNFNNHK